MEVVVEIFISMTVPRTAMKGKPYQRIPGPLYPLEPVVQVDDEILHPATEETVVQIQR